MLIDTHCHLEKKEYGNLDKLIESIFNADVKIMIVSGYDVATSREAVELAHKYKNIYATVGFHPSECNDIKEEDYIYFNEWLNDEKVVGIGEIGLDYHYSEEDKEKQQIMFKRQLDIAKKFMKPVVIHCRDAREDIYRILSDTNVKGIIHCFSDDLEYANKFIDLGFLLGIGGIITFKNSKLKSVIESIALDSIVLETDSPYLSPEPFRGIQNSPSNLSLIASAIATIKSNTYNEVAAITTSNASRVFDFNCNL